MVAVGGELQCAVALCEWDGHLFAHSAGIGHEEHQRQWLATTVTFRHQKVVFHGLARKGIVERELLELAQSFVFEGYKSAVGIFVDTHTSLMRAVRVLLLRGACHEAQECHRHKGAHFFHCTFFICNT